MCHRSLTSCSLNIRLFPFIGTLLARGFPADWWQILQLWPVRSTWVFHDKKILQICKNFTDYKNYFLLLCEHSIIPIPNYDSIFWEFCYQYFSKSERVSVKFYRSVQISYRENLNCLSIDSSCYDAIPIATNEIMKTWHLISCLAVNMKST